MLIQLNFILTEWIHNASSGLTRIVLKNEDSSNEISGRWKRINTLKHYQVRFKKKNIRNIIVYKCYWSSIIESSSSKCKNAP